MSHLVESWNLTATRGEGGGGTAQIILGTKWTYFYSVAGVLPLDSTTSGCGEFCVFREFDIGEYKICTLLHIYLS